MTSTQWTEYNGGTKRVTKQSVPTSEITAETVSVDGFVLSQKDTHGITSTQKRVFLAMGTKQEVTDGRGNTTTTVTDLIGRLLVVRDAAGNVTTTKPPTPVRGIGQQRSCCPQSEPLRRSRWSSGESTYCKDSDHPATITNAQGKTTCYAYDFRGRKVTETSARGIVKTHSYEAARGLLLGTTYSDGTPARSYTYNHLSQLTQVTDAAGTRTLSYNNDGELMTDSLLLAGTTHVISELFDDYGRSSGYTYKLQNGEVQQRVSYGYGADGRLSTAGFTHRGENKQFAYNYLPGSNLLQTLTMPNNMTLTQQYETQRDLLTAMVYKRGTTGVVERFYTYDTLGRPLTRQQNRQGGSRNDAFTHNDRSELTSATLGNATYSYAYDNIGNRKTAQENAEEATAYAANNLNQYTAVGEFMPEFDADGNQTKVQTCTGIWNVTYNAENRPTVFSRVNNDGTTTQVTCAYDYMGRRATKKVETITTNAETGESSSAINLNHAYIYRGYLQITCYNLQPVPYPCLWHIAWDPSQPVATRPLAIQMNSTWYCYGWDLTKNICEVFSNTGTINNTAIYSYTPYGEVTASGTVTQPIQWSSEFYDEELGLVYYNYRYYNPKEGRWTGMDPLTDPYNHILYSYCRNTPLCAYDIYGLISGNEVPNDGKSIEDIMGGIPDSQKKNCLYFVFYKNNTKGIYRWYNTEDNNYISHVGVYSESLKMAIGFSPEKDGQQIVEDTRTDIVLVLECCNACNTNKVNEALSWSFNNGAQYHKITKNGKNVNGEDWKINGPNCAVFAHNIFEIYYDFAPFTTAKWDSNIWGTGPAPRPEELRSLISNSNKCHQVYKDNNWKGKDNTPKRK